MKATHQVVDFGTGVNDVTIGYPFQGTEAECSEWITKHQEIHNLRTRYALQEIPR